jgi:hypothetical protein
VGRLEELPGQGSLKRPGKKLYAERDRFGHWQHLLGARNVLLSYTVESPSHGLIRRLEVQAHLGDEGEDDLCSVEEFNQRWEKLQRFMAMVGVLPVDDPVCVRLDPAVDVVYEDPLDGQRALEGLRYARWGSGMHAEFQGPPPYTTVAVKRGTKTHARAYCRNTKLKNGGPRWGKIRFEREQRFPWQMRFPIDALQGPIAAEMFWNSMFGSGAVAGIVTRIPREVQTLRLAERVETGDLTTGRYEQLSGYLDAERLGITDRIYNVETARRRRLLAKSLGIAQADADAASVELSLDDLLSVPRSAWAA